MKEIIQIIIGLYTGGVIATAMLFSQKRIELFYKKRRKRSNSRGYINNINLLFNISCNAI